jgi:hybrid cluster-associated redox disulfide protein
VDPIIINDVECVVKMKYGQVQGTGTYLSRGNVYSYYTMEITADSTIYDLLRTKPESSEVLLKFGMGCVGCAIARGETIREAAEVHGIPLEELLAALGIEE